MLVSNVAKVLDALVATWPKPGPATCKLCSAVVVERDLPTLRPKYAPSKPADAADGANATAAKPQITLAAKELMQRALAFVVLPLAGSYNGRHCAPGSEAPDQFHLLALAPHLEAIQEA